MPRTTNTEAELKSIVAAALGVEESQVTKETDLSGLDSLDAVEAVMDIECAFSIQIEDEAIEEFGNRSRKTFGDLVEAVEKLL